jgi:hypothetical protein
MACINLCLRLSPGAQELDAKNTHVWVCAGSMLPYFDSIVRVLYLFTRPFQLTPLAQQTRIQLIYCQWTAMLSPLTQ